MIVQKVLHEEEEDETESVGTIDLLEQDDEGYLWEIDDPFSDAIETVPTAESDDSMFEPRTRSMRFSSSRTNKCLPYSVSISLRDETHNQVATSLDCMAEKDEAMIDETVMMSQRGKTPHHGSSMDDLIKSMNRRSSSSSSSTQHGLFHECVGTTRMSVFPAASAIALPDEQRPMPCDTHSIIKSRNMPPSCNPVSNLKKRTYSLRAGSEESTLHDQDQTDGYRPPNKKRGRLPVDASGLEENATSPLWSSPISQKASEDDETIVPTPPTDEDDNSRVVNALIALARWEFRAHLLPIR